MTPSLAPPSRWRRSTFYPVFGAALAQGAPLGLLALRQLLSGGVSLHAALLELARDPVTYGYVGLSTTVVFVTLGLILGRSADRLTVSATTDPLTGLANRRAFHERVLLEVKRAHRYGSPLAVLLVDVDHLKLINDRAGHEGGDLALRSVSDVLSASCRATDMVARWGGDEFIVLAPGTSAEEAVGFATRIREALARVSRTRSNPTTVSIGIADTADLGGDATPEVLYAAADAALYEAKAAGRDRAVVSTRRPPSAA